MRKELSKANALVIFESASRLGNFSKAAQELSISRVSVSRQIAELESFLNMQLFNRNHRNVSLTFAGKELQSKVNPALYTIAEAMESIRESRKSSRLTVTSTISMSTFWLMPRLVDFYAKYPDIEINLMLSDSYIDLEAEQVDVAIRYGEHPPNVGNCSVLMKETLVPVYSPKYKFLTGLENIVNLTEERLLSVYGNYRPISGWRNWFRNAGIHNVKFHAEIITNTYITMQQAALEGHGIALLGEHLCNDHLYTGDLMRLPYFHTVEGLNHYIVDMTDNSSASQKFCTWLREEMNKTLNLCNAQ